MRKVIAVIIAAFILGTGLTVTADAAGGPQAQIARLKAEVKALRADRNYWEDTANALKSQQAQTVNYPAINALGDTGSATTLYRVIWTDGGVVYVSNPLYSEKTKDYFVSIVTNDPHTLPGSVHVQTSTVGPWS